MFNIRVKLVVPGTGEIIDRFLVATDEDNAPRSVATRSEVLAFVAMTIDRPEFRAVEVVPAE